VRKTMKNLGIVDVGFEVLTAVVMNNSIFLDITNLA
jgi:hypothetical protein